MMKDFAQLVKRVETRWLDVLYDFCQGRFQQVKLPSHDHWHHLRVWLIAKELLQELHRSGHAVTEHDVEKTIFAAFFHDIGMTVTREKQHGHIGRDICEAFFAEHQVEPIAGFGDVLHAIEHHDDKEYTSIVYHHQTVRTSLLSVLCVSDDLDAFGAIGVFRYAEIYLLRDVPIAELAGKVLENLRSRYANFQQLYGHLEEFFKHHSHRYHITKTFYQDLARQLQQYSYSEDMWEGSAGVLNYFLKYLIGGETALEDVAELVLANSRDHYVLDFFHKFQQELTDWIED